MAVRSGYIGREPGDSSIVVARETFEPTGVQTSFTVTATYTPGYLDVYLNGSRLVAANDYTASDGTTFDLTTAANNGDILESVAYKAFNLGQPISDITGNLDVTGNISASSSITASGSFYGDGSGITGVAATDVVHTRALTVSGVSTLSDTLNLSQGLMGIGATFTGNVSVGGTLTHEDVTNVDSVGIVTAGLGVRITAGGLNITAGILTAAGDIRGSGNFNAAGITTLTGHVSTGTTVGAGASIYFPDSKGVNFGNASEGDFQIFHDSTTNVINSASANLEIRHGTEKLAAFTQDAQAELYYDNTKRIETTTDGAYITGIGTISGELSAVGGADFAGQLKEGVKITAGKLSDNLNINTADGMVHMFTVAETASSTPNIRYDGSNTLASKMAVGETVTVTIITTTSSTSYYSAEMTIDTGAQTEEWLGGSAPSAGSGSGYDVYTYNIIKTASAPTYVVLANFSNFA